MRASLTSLLFLLLASGVMGFTSTKKLDPKTARPAFAASPSVSKMEKEETAPATIAGGNSPSFAFGANPAVSMAPAVVDDHDDEDELFSLGTAVISCALSLALGFTIGYGT